MTNLKYNRPKSLDEALGQLASGRPLGGGTSLTPQRHRIESVVDLQDLGLSDLTESRGRVIAGATCTLQQLVEAEGLVSLELARACRQEAAWNLRNMGTVAGAVLACDGRSPLAAALLAIGARVRLAPGAADWDVDSLLDRRPLDPGRIVTSFGWPSTATVRFEQVARSPADRAIVLAAIGRPDSDSFRVVLGGHGSRPVRVREAESAVADGDAVAAGRAAAAAYAEAGDVWGSAEYRSHAAGVLVRRLASEVLG
jgi:CO/xanthine dehydrogenase FAD-binding subunit